MHEKGRRRTDLLSWFQIFDGHNGTAAAVFTRENLLNHILGAIPRGLGREEWLQALPRALVAGFVKTDKEFQSRGKKIPLGFPAILLLLLSPCFLSLNISSSDVTA